MNRREFIKGACAGIVYSIIPIGSMPMPPDIEYTWTINHITKNIEFVGGIVKGPMDLIKLHAFLHKEWEIVYEGIV